MFITVYMFADADEGGCNFQTARSNRDQPVIWINMQVGAWNVYIVVGHDAGLPDDAVYTTLLRHAIVWIAGMR